MNLLILFISLFLVTGCQQQDQPRHYTEIVTQTPVDNALDASNPYTWTLPEGFKQGPDKEMRLASFYLEADPEAIDCSIVALPGMAGGMEANLKRWMGQIGVDPSDVNYQRIVDGAGIIQTRGGMIAHFYDLMSLQDGPSDKSMVAAIINTNDTTIFVKMTGSTQHLKENRHRFFDLLKSLASKQ